MLRREAAALDRYLVQRDREPEWDDAAFFASRVCRLTPDRLAELNRSTIAVIDRLAVADDDAPANARQVRVIALGFPQPEPTP
jgi:hypothetical protein